MQPRCMCFLSRRALTRRAGRLSEGAYLDNDLLLSIRVWRDARRPCERSRCGCLHRGESPPSRTGNLIRSAHPQPGSPQRNSGHRSSPPAALNVNSRPKCPTLPLLHTLCGFEGLWLATSAHDRETSSSRSGEGGRENVCRVRQGAEGEAAGTSATPHCARQDVLRYDFRTSEIRLRGSPNRFPAEYGSRVPEIVYTRNSK